MSHFRRLSYTDQENSLLPHYLPSIPKPKVACQLWIMEIVSRRSHFSMSKVFEVWYLQVEIVLTSANMWKVLHLKFMVALWLRCQDWLILLLNVTTAHTYGSLAMADLNLGPPRDAISSWTFSWCLQTLCSCFIWYLSFTQPGPYSHAQQLRQAPGAWISCPL